jgi:hypothetical protein
VLKRVLYDLAVILSNEKPHNGALHAVIYRKIYRNPNLSLAHGLE